ncbi:predicted protein [Nematostella vectensis]|uniref:Uncharacterized protein n=1 Tax=Nematostella vectensis TaxID=45351 RepID=A7S4F2_NEMVE|nr:UPF0538 protein C2orf76 homolog isoform X1 [Nematostella vectensis]EDO41404.1 predicted protein [Nematostella vectensis]|eukprot:XP_001633467.1 predicted protein [Nematostella vectensis]
MAEERDPVTVVVRLIRSFEYRNIKHVAFKNVSLSQTAKDFGEFVKKEVESRKDVPPPFRSFRYDKFKIQHKAHHAKTNDPVIRTDDDDTLILKEELTLDANGVEHETELSFFNYDDYLKYKENPQLKW